MYSLCLCMCLHAKYVICVISLRTFLSVGTCTHGCLASAEHGSAKGHMHAHNNCLSPPQGIQIRATITWHSSAISIPCFTTKSVGSPRTANMCCMHSCMAQPALKA